MEYYKDENDNVYAYEDGATPKDGLTPITELEANEILAPSVDDLVSLIKNHRDQYIEQDITVSGITVTNTQEEQQNIARISNAWMADKSVSTIKFKHNNGIDDVTHATLQGLLKDMFAREQVGRNAEAVVLTNHANTPYTDIQDAYVDFDGEVA